MKIIATIFISFCFFTHLTAQKISKININNSGVLQTFTITTDDNAVVILNPNGEVVNYGTEYFSEKIQNYSRIEKFNGRVELFAATDDKAMQGKVKYIGRTAVTYYASYDLESLRGKIKSIGNLPVTYFMEYDDAFLKGKIKSIGTTQLQYFSGFDNEALRGKLKAVGSTNLNYYSSFEDKAFKGKIKNVGPVSFTYYSSFEKQYGGAMKTGNYTQNVAGITYLFQ